MIDKLKNKCFKISHSGELLIWLIVLLIIISICSITHTRHIQDDNDYTIFMNDVDGLIVGSPVRIMGIEVGHITKIKPTNNEMYVKFIITDNNIQLPRGTIATVEFSGMAGSKSLEIYLPEKYRYIDQNVPLIEVHPPKRLNDAAGLLNEMLDKISSIMYTTSSFGSKLDFIDIDINNKDNNLNAFIEYANNLVEKTDTKRKKIDIQSLKESNKNGIK